MALSSQHPRAAVHLVLDFSSRVSFAAYSGVPALSSTGDLVQVPSLPWPRASGGTQGASLSIVVPSV